MRNQKYNSQYHGNGAMYHDEALREFDPEIAHTVGSQVFGQVINRQGGREMLASALERPFHASSSVCYLYHNIFFSNLLLL